MQRTLLASTAALALMLGVGSAKATYELTALIPIPPAASNTSGNFAAFDISYFDPSTQLDYVADRSNRTVDVFSAQTNTFVTQVTGDPPFAGALPPDPVGGPNSTSGPDGVQVVNLTGQHQLWVGDGPSTVYTYNIAGPPQNPNINQKGPPLNTGGQFRADEMAFSPTANTILVANNADGPAFATLINAKNGQVIAGHIVVPQGGTGGGLEASDFNAKTGTFFLAVPQLAAVAGAKGGVAEINASTGALIRTINLQNIGGTNACGNCSPTGLAVAKNGTIMVGDGTPGGTGSIIFDPVTNKVIAVLSALNGVDQIWYDPTTNRWFAAGSNAAGGPILGIVDAATDTILQIIDTTPGDHSVSVDPISGEIFVPFAANAANGFCPKGCEAVFSNVASAVPEPSTWAMMLLGFVGLGFMFHRSRRKVSFA